MCLYTYIDLHRNCFLLNAFVVKKPSRISHEEAAATIGDAVRAYTALHYHTHVCAGDTVLIMDGATPAGSIAVQMAQLWGAKVKILSVAAVIVVIIIAFIFIMVGCGGGGGVCRHAGIAQWLEHRTRD